MQNKTTQLLYCLCFVMLFTSAVKLHAADSELWLKSGFRATAFDGGSGTQTDPYRIANAGQLAYLAYLVNEYSGTIYNSQGKYYQLVSDIDLGAHLWEPIGFWSDYSSQPTKTFNGIFDGNGFIIKNMTIKDGTRGFDTYSIYHGRGQNMCLGLFGTIRGNVTVKNIFFENAIIEAKKTYHGGVVAGDISLSFTVNIENCHVKNSKIGVLDTFGGLVGKIEGATVNLRASSVRNTIIDSYQMEGGGNDAGGLVGTLRNGTLNMSDCLFAGKLLMNDGGKNASFGGILGWLQAGVFNVKRVVQMGHFDYGGIAGPGYRGLLVGNYSSSAVRKMSGTNFGWGVTVPDDNVIWIVGIKNFNPSNIAKRTSIAEIKKLDLNADENTGEKIWYLDAKDSLRNDGQAFFRRPKYLNAEVLKETGRIKLSWTQSVGCETTSPQPFSLQMRRVGESQWREVVIKKGHLNYSDTISRTIEIQYPDINKAAAEYEFRIRRADVAWDNDILLSKTKLALPAYPVPVNPVVLPIKNTDSDITLRWNLVQPATTDSPTGDYVIEWSFDGNQWNAINSLTKGNLTVDLNKTTQEIAFAYPEAMLNKGIKNVQFRIRRANFEWNEMVNGVSSTAKTSYAELNTNIVKFKGIYAEGSSSGIKVLWEQDNGRLNDTWYFRLYRKNVDQADFDYSANFVDQVRVSAIGSNLSIMDNYLTESCIPFHYQVRLEEGDDYNTAVVKSESAVMKNPDVVKLFEAKGNIESVSVSKGFFNDRVVVKWKVTAGNTFSRYSITRRMIDAENAGTESLHEFVPVSAHTTQYSYIDNSAIPGIYYSYEVKAWNDCGDRSTESAKMSSIGFIQPLGVVSGKVTFEGGNAVSGVSVIVESDASSQYANRSLPFSTELDNHVKLPFKADLWSPTAFTTQFWIRETRTDYNASYFSAKYRYALRADSTTAYKLTFDTWDGVSTTDFYDDGRYSFIFNYKLPLNEWVHVTVSYAVSENSGTAKLYINGKHFETITQVYENMVSGFMTDAIYSGAYPGVEDIFIGSTYLSDVYYYNQNQQAQKAQKQRSNYTQNNYNPNPYIEIKYNLNAYLDEFRFWKTALDSATILSNYDSYLSGKEANLSLYYRFNEPMIQEVFDISGRNGVFNENHGKMISSSLLRSAVYVPPCYNKATTDVNGNYLITTIPYTGEGSTAILKPLLGIHKFSPGNKPLFFSQASATYNNVDFTDVSAFKVQGKVVYEGSNYPVSGCSFRIDGTQASVGGQVVTTDAEGKFTLSVPIGKHTLQIEKSGHVFANNGFAQIKKSNMIDFQDDITEMNFVDKTKVKLIGRVTGGLKENDKVLGFGESLNNIGVDSITLINTKSDQYDLRLAESDSTAIMNHNNGEWKRTGVLSNDTSIVKYQKDKVTIHVSPKTGEFVAWLIPEKFSIDDINVKTADGKMTIYNQRAQLDLSNKAVPNDSYMQTEVRTWIDSVFVTDKKGMVDHWEYSEKSDTVRYHDKWQWYYQSTPTFSMQQIVNNEVVPYLGEKTFVVRDQLTGQTDTLQLATVHANDSASYLFGKPVFRQGNAYTMYFKAYEEYINYSAGTASPVITHTAVTGTVNVDNTIALKQEGQNGNIVGVELDEQGTAKYTFVGGLPDLTTAQNQISATVQIGNFSYYWNRGSDPVTAWHLGEKSTGTDFMTSGPNEIDMVLHDPPGSSSYSYIEKGSKMSSTTTTSVDNEVLKELNATLDFGAEITMFVGVWGGFGGGVMAGVVETAETKLDVKTGIKSEQKWNKSNEKTKTTTFSERLSTSDDPLYVGHLGDVFIGNSTNIQYGLTNGVSITKGDVETTPWAKAGADSVYKIAPSASIAYGQTFATRFVFTQVELEQIMIPKWKNAINLLLKDKGTVVDLNQIERPVYVSKLLRDDVNFGKMNTDKSAFKTLATPLSPYDGPSYTIYFPASWGDGNPWTEFGLEKHKTFQDSIVWANNQINGWTKALAESERSKVQMRQAGNYSFGGGSEMEYSIESTQSKSYTSSFTWVLSPSLGLTTGMEIKGIGTEIETSIEYTHSEAQTGTDEAEYTVNSGFVLKEDGFGDEISVDYGVTDLGAFAFKSRGGRTSCPHEAEVRSQYFEPGKHILSEGTMQIEVPKIDVYGPAKVLNVPANKAASFKLQMKNESETNDDVWFQLIVDEETNPDGAELQIDGGIIGNGRTFLVKAGEVLTKTLFVSKGSVDVYNNIGLVLRSTCQNDPTDFLPDIADTTWVSVEFIPACSEVAIKEPVNNWIVNTQNQSGDTLQIVIDSYDVNFPNFGYIRLEYRPTSSPSWSTITTFYPQALYANAQGVKENIGSRSSLVYKWKVPQDGPYELRATTASVNIDSENKIVGSPLSTYSSDAVSGYVDFSRPKSLGTPLPSNGILTSDGEISITFNEKIQNVYESMISVQASLNKGETDHSRAVKFTGGQPAYTEAGIALANRSFSFESFYNRKAGAAGTLLAHGDGLSVGFNSANKLVVTVQGVTYTSTNTLPSDEWCYLAFSYNNTSRYFDVYHYSGSISSKLGFDKTTQLNQTYSGLGRLFAGANLNVNMHELSLWTKDMSSINDHHMYSAKTGKELNMVGYWPMNEGHGSINTDKARSRHLILPSSQMWYSNFGNYAVHFNGSNYVEVPAANVALLEQDNFAIEFWFNGEKQSNATLFSCGDGVLDIEPSKKMSVAFDENSKLSLRTNGVAYVLSDSNYLDNTWHHFALNVLRNGSTVAYIDGEAVRQLPPTAVKWVNGDKYLLGANNYRSATEMNNVGKYFKGAIDEFRFWKSTLTAGAIRSDIYNRLTGSEDGLLVYIPFDRLAIESSMLVAYDSWTDAVTDSLLVNPVNGAVASDTNAPTLQVERPLQNVPFSFVASDNKIVITPTANAADIEGTTLEIRVKDVKDLHDNLVQPVSWIAYVNNNSLLWSEQNISISKEMLVPRQFSVSISNQSATNENWSVKELPGWLTVSKTHGTLKPLATDLLIFTVDEALPIGSYEETIYLTGNLQINSALNILLKVTGIKPGWTTQHANYELSMNLIGQLHFEGAVSEDSEDIVAAFIENECVGLASPEYYKNYDAYYLVMDIYGDDKHLNKPVIFKAWDASTGEIYPAANVSENITFVSNKLYGKMSTPVLVRASDYIEQSAMLQQGWNWMALNVKPVNMSLSGIFGSVDHKSVVLKNDIGFSVPTDATADIWNGTVDSLKIGKMYKLRMKESAELLISGRKVNPADVTVPITQNWNWIAYVPRFNMTVDEALSGLEAVENDMIKGQTQFAVYENGAWVGSLRSLVPGRGYLYYSGDNMPKSFIYPSVSSAAMRAKSVINESPLWSVANESAFDDNMPLIAVVKYDEQLVLNTQVGVFKDNECRATAISQPDGKLYISVRGNESDSYPLTFKVYSKDTDSYYDLTQTIVFNSGSIDYIDYQNPYVLQIKNETGLQNASKGKVRAYPVVVKTILHIEAVDFNVTRVVVCDISGKIIKHIENDDDVSTIDFTGVEPGIYIVKAVNAENEAHVLKIVKQ